MAVSNTLANCWGLLVPILGVWVKSRFDSYLPLFGQAIVAQLIGAVLFAKYARMESPLGGK